MNLIKNYRTTARFVLGASIAGTLLALPLAIQATTYSFIDLNPGSPFSQSYGYGVSGNQQVGSANEQAFLWSGTAASAVNLTPIGYSLCYAMATDGSQQIGYGRPGQYEHALLWSGAANSFVDLHPTGLAESYAFGVSGGQQIGYVTDASISGTPHAYLWSGTAISAVDLHPSGFSGSKGFGISGGQQVGTGSGYGGGSAHHALLWSGTAGSVVDLNPSGFTLSDAFAISGSQQVGSGISIGNEHALLWSGTAGSVVDLNPTGMTHSRGLGTSGSQQVGWANGPATGNEDHAFLWSGTAASAVDLDNFLSSDYSFSTAESIDADGNIVGFAYYIPTGETHAVIWVVPEPSAVILVAVGSVALLLRKRRGPG